jgi:hypothetical protein
MDLEQHSTEELQNMVRELEQNISALRKENFIFESHLKRHDQFQDKHATIQIEEEEDFEPMTTEQSFVVATNEAKELKIDLDKLKDQTEKTMEELRVFPMLFGLKFKV